MKSVSEYINLFRQISSENNLYGSSVDLLCQLLGNYAYIGEIENISYALESSLERCTQTNSKIQHCVDRMYSVFRGNCPRVILNFYSQSELNFKKYDIVYSGSDFKLYYLGYWDSREGGFTDELSNSNIDTLSIEPSGSKKTYTIKCLLASTLENQISPITSTQQYFVDILKQSYLSQDMYVYLERDGERHNLSVTRQYRDHLLSGSGLSGKLFDLTMPGYGTRLYGPGIFEKGDRLNVFCFNLCHLSDFNEFDLKSLRLQGTVACSFSEDPNPEKISVLDKFGKETAPGLILISSSEPDDMSTIHYKANQNRFSQSIIRTNDDLGVLLYEEFPQKVKNGGVSVIYDIPDTTTITEQKYYDNSILSSLQLEQLTQPLKFNQSEYRSYYKLDSIGDKSCFDESGPTDSVLQLALPETIKTAKLHLLHRSDVDINTNSETPIFYLSSNHNIINSAVSEIKIFLYQNGSQLNKLPENYSLWVSYDSDSKTNLSDQINNFSFKPKPIYREGTQTLVYRYLTILLINDNRIISSERIPVVSESSGYVLDTTLDTIVLESDSSGRLKENFPITLKTEVIFYDNTDVINNTYLKFSTLPLKDVDYQITPDGKIIINSLSDSVSSIDLPIVATYNGNRLTKLISLRKTNYFYSVTQMSRKFFVSTDPHGLSIKQEILSNASLQHDEIEIQATPISKVYIWPESYGIQLYDIYLEYTQKTVNNLLDSSSITVPKTSLFYVPQSDVELTDIEIKNFKETRIPYFLSKDITIQPADQITAVIDLGLGVYFQSNQVITKINEILSNYSNRLNVDLYQETDKIKSLINKISVIENIYKFDIKFFDSIGQEIEGSSVQPSRSYYIVKANINTIIL